MFLRELCARHTLYNINKGGSNIFKSLTLSLER